MYHVIMTVRYVGTPNSCFLESSGNTNSVSNPSMPYHKKKCVKSVISSIVLITFLIVIITYLVSAQPNIQPATEQTKNVSQPQKICLSETCIHTAATVLKMIDQTIDPCDNFYQFVCGNFVKNTAIPEEKTEVNTFSVLNEKVKLQMRSFLEKPLRSDDARPLKLLKTVYRSCLNVTQLETEALAFTKKIFKELGGWPVIESVWNERKFDWKQLLFRLRRTGWNVSIFVKMHIDIDMKNSSRRILTITQPYIPNYEALSKGINNTETQAYFDYMVKMVTLFGGSKLSASVEMNEVLEFEINLSKIVALYGRRDISSEYNPTTIKKLQERIHGIPWLQLINNFLAPMEMLTSKDVINVVVPKFLEDLETLLLNTKKRILANYMFWYIVKSSAAHLPERFRSQAFEYLKIVKGITRSESRWEQCIKEAYKLNVAASSLFVKKLFKRKNREAVDEIAAFIKDAFVEMIEEVDWMDSETKEQAILKARKIDLFLGYPDELLKSEEVEDYHRGLQLDPNNHYLKINLNVSSFLHKKQVKKLKQTINGSDWPAKAYSYTPNGFYKQKSNSIEIMAALIQEPFFHSERPQYANFGSIGEVIGHEILHAFDDEGKQFDRNGNLVNWWSQKSLEIFHLKAKCLIRQYGNLTVPETDLKISGTRTLDENIADNGGFKIAYRGYLKWLQKNAEESLLPGLPYTQRQLFWISAASDGCAKYKNEALKKFVVSGRHSPDFFRIMVSFMNFESFGRDFNCSEGTTMNPENKCRVW